MHMEGICGSHCELVNDFSTNQNHILSLVLEFAPIILFAVPNAALNFAGKYFTSLKRANVLHGKLERQVKEIGPG